MAISIIKGINNWDDDEFRRTINSKAYYEEHRRRIVSQDSCIGVCAWCGKPFLKQHHSEKYCGDDCRKDARGHQSRMKSHRWYHKHKHELSEKQRWGLGSGTLGGHMHKDFEKEQSMIEKEFTRLRLKRK